MANNSTPDVFLLLGVEGGSNIGKGSGLLISTQLKDIMDQVEATITSHLKVKLDQNALSELKTQINDTVTEALTSIKGTPVELTFSFNQDSIDKAFRDVKKQLKEQNITISAQPQEKKKQGDTGGTGGTNSGSNTSLGNIKKEAEAAKQSTNQIEKAAEAVKQEVKEAGKVVENTSQTIEDVFVKTFEKIDSRFQSSVISRQRLEMLHENIARAFSIDEINLFLNTLDQIKTPSGIKQFVITLQKANNEASDLASLVATLQSIISDQYSISMPSVLSTEDKEKSLSKLSTLKRFINSKPAQRRDGSEMTSVQYKEWLDKQGLDVYGNKIKGIVNDIEDVRSALRGLSAAYQDIVNYTDTNDLDTIFVKNYKGIKQTIEAETKYIENFRPQFEQFNKDIREAAQSLNISIDGGMLEVTLDQLTKMCERFPQLQPFLQEYIDTIRNRFVGDTTSAFDQVEKGIDDVTNAEKKLLKTQETVKYELSTFLQNKLPFLLNSDNIGSVPPASLIKASGAGVSDEPLRIYEEMQKRIKAQLEDKMRSLSSTTPMLPENSTATITEQLREQIVAMMRQIPVSLLQSLKNNNEFFSMQEQMREDINNLMRSWVALPEISTATTEEKARQYEMFFNAIRRIIASGFIASGMESKSSIIPTIPSSTAIIPVSRQYPTTSSETIIDVLPEDIKEVRVETENLEKSAEKAEAAEAKALERLEVTMSSAYARLSAINKEINNMDWSQFSSGSEGQNLITQRNNILSLIQAIQYYQQLSEDDKKNFNWGDYIDDVDSLAGAVRKLNDQLAITGNEVRRTKNNGSLIPDNAALSAIQRYNEALRIFKSTQGANTYQDLFNLTERDINNLDEAKLHIRSINAETQRLITTTNQLTKTNREEQNVVTQRNKIYQEAKNYYDKYQSGIRANIALNQKWQDTLKQLHDGRFGDNESARRALAELQTATKDANAETMTLWGSLKKLFTDHFGSVSATAFIGTLRNVLRGAYENVLEIDKAMTELRKVTDLTEQQYESFQRRAADTAKEVGGSIADTIRSTADYSRLGFNLPDSESLAKAALVYKNVGDGLENIDEASESIISTIKAFSDVNASDAMSIIDKFNEVGETSVELPTPRLIQNRWQIAISVNGWRQLRPREGYYIYCY